MRVICGTPAACAGRGRWGCITLLVGVTVLQFFHSENMRVFDRLLDQVDTQSPTGQSQTRVDVEKIKNNYYAALAAEYGCNYGPKYGSYGGDLSNKDRSMQKQQQHIEQSRYLRRMNNARRQQKRATVWRDSQAERAFRRQHSTFDRGKDFFGGKIGRQRKN